MAQKAHSDLDVLGTNKTHNIVTAKFKKVDERISLSTLNGRDIEVRAEKYKDNQYIITFAVDKSLTRTKAASTKDTRAILKRVHQMVGEQVKHLPSGSLLYAEPHNADRSGRARRAIYQRWGFRDANDGIGLMMRASAWGSNRLDSPEKAKGKPCGASHIPKQFKCSKTTTSITPQILKTAGTIGLVSGAIAGGLLVARRVKRGRPMSMEEWRNSPENARNNPKLSPEDAKRISDEAIAGGQKWDVQEKINARRQAQINAACSQSAGKIQAPAKFDAAIPNPRCQAGAGAFGTYFVHTSQKYGIKLFRDPETDVSREFDLLGKAHAAGVSVPEPLSLNAVQPANQSSLYDDEPRAQTLVLSHMQGYKTISDVYVSGYGTAVNAPRIVQLKIAREFRKLHTEGMAHGDIHSGNIMVNERSKKVAIVDFGYATELDSPTHPEHYRDGIENLTNDLRRLPEFVGFERVAAADFLERNKGVIANVEKQAQQARDSYRSWDSFELAINRYHDVLEQELLWDERKPRSRFISGAHQPRIPGLTRRILTANMNTRERGMLVGPRRVDSYFRGVAKQLGVRARPRPPRTLSSPSAMPASRNSAKSLLALHFSLQHGSVTLDREPAL
jgi:tRNA A-37 threonylcarbamoyl transferase component Bud32